MIEKDVFDEIIDLGKRRGTLTYDEINDAFPSEFVSPGELSDFMDLLQDIGIEVIDNQELCTEDEECLEEEEEDEYEKTEELSNNRHILDSTFNKVLRNTYLRNYFTLT